MRGPINRLKKQLEVLAAVQAEDAVLREYHERLALAAEARLAVQRCRERLAAGIPPEPATPQFLQLVAEAREVLRECQRDSEIKIRPATKRR